MRKIEAGDKISYLTERQWKQLVHRFDIHRANHTYKRPCICQEFPSCSNCPFSVGGYSFSCMSLLRMLGLQTDLLCFERATIKALGQEGLVQARAIFEWLAGLPKGLR